MLFPSMLMLPDSIPLKRFLLWALDIPFPFEAGGQCVHISRLGLFDQNRHPGTPLSLRSY